MRLCVLVSLWRDPTQRAITPPPPIDAVSGTLGAQASIPAVPGPRLPEKTLSCPIRRSSIPLVARSSPRLHKPASS